MFAAAQSLFASGASASQKPLPEGIRRITAQEPFNPHTEIASKFRPGFALFVPKKATEECLARSYDAYNLEVDQLSRLAAQRDALQAQMELNNAVAAEQRDQSDRATYIARHHMNMAQQDNDQLRAQLTAQGHAAAPGQNGAGAQNDVRISLLQAERSALQTWNAQYNVTIANLRRDLQDTGTQRDALLAQRNALLDQIRYNNAIADAQRAQINKSHALQLAFITGASMLLVGYLDSLERKNLIESGLTREQANKTMLVERFSFLFVPTMILGAIAPASFAITYAIPLALSIASVSFDNYHEPDAEKIKKCENIRAIASKNGLVMKGQWGNPPLMQTNNPTIIKELIAAGVDVNETNRFNETALMQTRSPEIAELLIKAGADIEALDLFDRTTPLIGAAQYRGKDLLQMLIEHGANLYATNKDGLTALDIARNEVESCKKDFPLLLKNAQDCVDLLEDAMKNPDKFKKVTRSKDASSSVEKVIESEQKIQGEVRDIYELYTF